MASVYAMLACSPHDEGSRAQPSSRPWPYFCHHAQLQSDGECHCGRDLDRGEAVSLHHVINWDRVSFRVSLLVVGERAAASLGVAHVATGPDLMPSVQLNRRDLGAS